MARRKLGDLETSDWSLGTMTFGKDTSRTDAFSQMDAAVDAGVTLFDCAEMYPVNPPTKEEFGVSEEVIGKWFVTSGRRGRVQIATKVSGPNGFGIRGGEGYDKNTLREAVEGSLRRLQTDVIDLYQLHWPNRGSYHFRQNWDYRPDGSEKLKVLNHIEEMVLAIGALIQEGKIRSWGLSNETAWGLTYWTLAAGWHGVPEPITVQNEYSLLSRLYDTDVAEVALMDDLTLLAYSPLATGLLTGKYNGGAIPVGSRAALNKSRGGDGLLGGRVTDRVWPAVDGYLQIAHQNGMDPVHMALAWLKTRPFPVIPIVGATRFQQLDHMLSGKHLELSQEVVDQIEAMHKQHPMPY